MWPLRESSAPEIVVAPEGAGIDGGCQNFYGYRGFGEVALFQLDYARQLLELPTHGIDQNVSDGKCDRRVVGIGFVGGCGSRGRDAKGAYRENDGNDFGNFTETFLRRR